MNLGRIFLLNILLGSIFGMVFLTSAAWADSCAGEPDETIVSQDKVAVLILDYDQQTVITQKAIDDLKADLKWVRLRINEVENMGRTVPKEMHDAVSYRVLRINVLQEQLGEYRKYLETLRRMQGEDHAGLSHEGSGNITLDSLEARIRSARLANWLDLARDTDTGLCTARTALPILFPSGSAKIASNYASFLKNLAGLIKAYPVKVLVKGHTDPDPIKTKKYPSNFELGAARAANVVHSLVKHGVNPSVFSIKSSGQYPGGKISSTSQKALERHVNLEIRFL